MKKFNKTRAKKKLDQKFSAYIRIIGFCEAEGKVPGVKCGGGLQCAHIENRSNIHLRWDENNCLCLCHGHHFWFHRNPLQFIEFLLKYQKHKYDYVRKNRNQLQKFTEEFYEEMMEGL